MGEGLLVVDGGDRFWYSFFPVVEGQLRGRAEGVLMPPSAVGLVTAVGIYPSDDFMDTEGAVATGAAAVLGEGNWTCVKVKVQEAVIVEVESFGHLVVHVEALFAYSDGQGREKAVRVAGNSREGLRAASPDASEAALKELLGS